MSESPEFFCSDHTALTADSRLLTLRATLAGVPLSWTASCEGLSDAGWALEAIREAVERSVDEIIVDLDEDLLRSLCFAVRAGLTHARHELLQQASDPYQAPARARAVLLRALVLVTEVRNLWSRKRKEPRTLPDPMEIARAVVLSAIRANANDDEWITLVAEAEISLLATLPPELMGPEFRRKLGLLRTLVTECTRYEFRNAPSDVAGELQRALRGAGSAL